MVLGDRKGLQQKERNKKTSFMDGGIEIQRGESKSFEFYRAANVKMLEEEIY